MSFSNGACPPTHPILLPHLFFEVLYSMDGVDTSDGGKFVFANGDDVSHLLQIEKSLLTIDRLVMRFMETSSTGKLDINPFRISSTLK
jgi:hypothetical protein